MRNSENISNICALRFKEALNDNSVKAVELSERSNISKSTLSHYAHGTRIPTRENANIIGQILNVSPVWLMGFNVDKYSTSTKAQHTEELLTLFSKLNEEQQEKVLSLLKTMV